MATTAAPVATVASEDSRLTRAGVAVLRIGVALLWIQNVGWKVPPDFGERDNGGLYHFTRFAVDNPVFGPYASFIENVVLPNFAFFGWLTVLIEGGLGAFLLVGLLTRFWAVIGIVQTLAITLSVLNAPNEWHWSYFLMILAHLAILATAAGRSFGVDSVLHPRWARSPGRLSTLLARMS